MILGWNAGRRLSSLALLALLSSSVACAASTGSGSKTSIRGRVIGPEGPIDEVRITTEPATDAVLTLSGNYKIDEVVATQTPLVPGKYKLIAFKSGWKPAERTIEYDGGDLEVPDIELVPNDPAARVIEDTDVPVNDPKKAVQGSGRVIDGE